MIRADKIERYLKLSHDIIMRNVNLEDDNVNNKVSDIHNEINLIKINIIWIILLLICMKNM